MDQAESTSSSSETTRRARTQGAPPKVQHRAMADWQDKLEALDIPENAVPGLTMADKPTLEGKLLQLSDDKAARFFNGAPMDVLKKLWTLLPLANAGKLTARGVMQLPLPLPQLTPRHTPRSSKSKTRPRRPRTFSDVLPWPEFSQGASQLLLSLDDTAAIYKEPTDGIWPGNPPVQAAAEESEVRSLITSLARSTNQLAHDINITARLSGGGSNRSSSFTDLVVRPAEQVTDKEHLSALIWGVGEVKGDWQLSIERSLQLPSAVQNKAELDDFLPGLQQVYGDGVMDEAPLLILTNYHATFFLRRSGNVLDKRLWASSAVWWDQAEPPARVCWLYALQQAQELQPLKASLRRVAVPHTLAGYALPQQLDSARETESTSSLRCSKRQRSAQEAAQPVTVLKAQSMTGKGHEELRPAAAAGLPNPAAGGGLLPLHGPDVPDSFANERELGISSLALTDTLLGSGRFGQVLQGYLGEPVAVKMYDLRVHGAAEAFHNEKAAYGVLEALQGSALPRLVTTGILAHLSVPVVVTSIGGEPLEKRLTGDGPTGLVPQNLHWPLRAALQQLHGAHVAHGDVCLSNMLTNGTTRVCLIDLGSAAINASKAEMTQDSMRLKDMLHKAHLKR